MAVHFLGRKGLFRTGAYLWPGRAQSAVTMINNGVLLRIWKCPPRFLARLMMSPYCVWSVAVRHTHTRTHALTHTQGEETLCYCLPLNQVISTADYKRKREGRGGGGGLFKKRFYVCRFGFSIKPWRWGFFRNRVCVLGWCRGRLMVFSSCARPLKAINAS